MSALKSKSQKPPRTRVIDAITDAPRRSLLAHLVEHGRTSEGVLANVLAKADDRTTADGSGRDAPSTIRTQLRHVHLPRLADAGLVSWDRSEETVAPVGPAQDDTWVTRVLEVADEDWDAALSAVENERRAHAVAAVVAEDGTLRREALALEVASREADGTPSSSAIQRVQRRLHHVHLPALDDAGLVDYDVETGAVSAEEQPDSLTRLLDILPEVRRS
jgi:hypothetical protein